MHWSVDILSVMTAIRWRPSPRKDREAGAPNGRPGVGIPTANRGYGPRVVRQAITEDSKMPEKIRELFGLMFKWALSASRDGLVLGARDARGF